MATSISADVVPSRQSSTPHIVFASSEGPSSSNAEMARRNSQDEKERLKKLLGQDKKLQECLVICQGCGEPIFERYIWHCSGLEKERWHGGCLTCSVCRQRLASKCFSKDDKLFCKNDFYRTFGSRCGGCQQGIAPDDMVRHANEETYHLDCFACFVCGKQFSTGEEYYLMENKKLVCKVDYESARSKEASNKRPRTTISAKQLETLKIAYTASSKPARHIREQLSQDTGLDMRVVQVWFQNRRAKEKRLKKDAGRNGWSQYFNGTMRKYDLDDDDDMMIEDDTMCSEKVEYQEHCGQRNGYIDEDSSSDSFANHCKSPPMSYSSPDPSAPGHNPYLHSRHCHPHRHAAPQDPPRGPPMESSPFLAHHTPLRYPLFVPLQPQSM